MFSRKLKYCIVALIAVFFIFYAHNRAGYHLSERFLISPGDTLVFSVRDRYGDYFLHRLEPVGYQLDLIRAFAKSQQCAYRIVIEPEPEQRWKSLLKGEVDILVCNIEVDSIRAKYDKQVVSSMALDKASNAIWVTSIKNISLVNAINRWLAQYSETEAHQQQQQKYFVSLMTLPIRKTYASLSPYDALIKYYAERIGWDWRLLASLICQESRFQNDVISKRGAEGLMQVMPQTAERFGVFDLQDPKENLRAGTSYLLSLKKHFSANEEMDETNRIKFILASYNAGLGRIIDCQQFAKSLNKNPHVWEEVASVVPLMRHEVYYAGDVLKLGRFRGDETLRFVETIIDRYQHYQNLVME